MANTNCIAHCAVCQNTFARKTGPGRPAIYCSSDCKAKRDAMRTRQPRQYKPRKEPKSPFYSHCHHCGCAIDEQRRGKMYCSSRCACRQRDGTKLTRAQYREKCKAEAKHTFTCVCCGKGAHRKQSGTNASKGYNNKYCSMACRVAVASTIRDEVAFLRGLHERGEDQVRAKKAKLRAIVRMLARIALFKERASAPCLCCGGPVGWSATIPRKYCSKECVAKMPHSIAARRANKAKRAARERGAGRCESINPIAVFMAAGWRCQLCGKPTPQRLRGSYHKRAPEMDHVKPLSKGGTHTLDNVQCLCRECNGWKSDRVVVGQIGLFTGLI